MKIKLFILSLFIWVNGFGQKLPITGLCLSDVLAVTGGTCLSQAFANANPAYFDPAYAVTGNCLADFRNYGTTCSSLATILTTYMTALSSTTASAEINCTSYGSGCTVIEMGMCYSTLVNPTTSDSKTTTTVAIGANVFTITGLTPNTIYHCRAYAINSYGTAYGSDEIMYPYCTTRPTGLNIYGFLNSYTDGSGYHTITNLSTACTAYSCFVNNSCGNITASSTTVEAASLSDGQTAYFGTGVTNCNKITDGWYIALTSPSFLLTSATIVQVSLGKIYLSTCGYVAPTVTTNSISNITYTTATSGGNVTADGGASVTERGIVINTTSNPTTGSYLQKLTSGTGTGSYSIDITGLSVGTTYHVRAYAINSAGISYGSDVSFTTASINVPTVSTISADFTDINTLYTSGTISSDGGATVTARGFCWSTSANPTISDNFAIVGSGTGNFNYSIFGLAEHTTYYVRAFAENSQGISYGDNMTANTDWIPQ